MKDKGIMIFPKWLKEPAWKKVVREKDHYSIWPPYKLELICQEESWQISKAA